ncbi:endonuclease domain-containing 1 protein-like [Melanotaenia boesemani]|uniref:endonuclease domain-containing 1 protein-like n=1 Tax=Melanotaenia boesemani TaxID=1250792 RepID=UPI001C05C586|nr:endonuclease domain-containing 1 protein-like [Melanotaenia boesemani]
MMKWFLFLAAFLPITPTMTEVVASVSECSEFLLEGSPPQIPGIIENGAIKNQNRYKPICQTFNNKRRFLTVYDTKNRIPVFSAYKFKEITSKKNPDNDWKIEPQLLVDLKKNMMTEDEIYTTQAINRDYENSDRKGYDRGHLYPNSHGSEDDDKESTYTLTNIVPQAKEFNSGSWSKMENCVKCVMEKVCISNGVLEGFVVVGAYPSTNSFLKERVNIPTQLLSAFCCYNSIKKKWLAGAHWAPNTKESGNINIRTKTVEELNKELNKLLSTKASAFNVFPGQKECLKPTVTEFSQELQGCGCN